MYFLALDICQVFDAETSGNPCCKLSAYSCGSQTLQANLRSHKCSERVGDYRDAIANIMLSVGKECFSPAYSFQMSPADPSVELSFS